MIRKILINVILIILILGINFCSFAEDDIDYNFDFDFARIEAEGNYEPVEVPPVPEDEPKPNYDDDKKNKNDKPEDADSSEAKATITIPTTLNGVVWEDQDKIELDNSGLAGTKHITNNYIYDSNESAVSGVQVTLNGTHDLSITTDSDGKYSYSAPGTFNVGFKFGESTDSNNYRLNKDTLKYNGQDYSMVTMLNGYTAYEKNYIRKIKEVKKSYTEVYILIDYSASMRIPEANGISRLDIVRQAAINFVNELFEESEGDIAVGFIAFAYDAVIVKNPTDVREDVIDGINRFNVVQGSGVYSGKASTNFTSLNNKVGTNLGGAVLKAMNSYLSPDSNKVMVLFSDGAVTAHEGVDSLYASDTNEQIAEKLEKIAILTNADLMTVVNSGINLVNVLNKTSGTERIYVEKAFKFGDSWIGNCYEVDYTNEIAVRTALIKDVKKVIESTESEFTSYSDTKTFHGNDDLSRRTVVNQKYDNLYYDKLKLFEVIDNLNGNEDNDKNIVSNWINPDNNYSNSKKTNVYKEFINDNMDLKKFIQDTWMSTEKTNITLYKVHTNSEGKIDYITNGSSKVYTFTYYSIERLDEDGNGTGIWDDYCYVQDNLNGTLTGEYKAGNVSVNQTTITLNGALIKRDEFKLELEKLVTGVKLTLSDGTVLYHILSDNAYKTVEKNQEAKELFAKQLQKRAGLIDNINTKVNNLKINEINSFPDQICLIVDTETLQGATLEVEYTFVVKNNSGNSTFNKEFSIVDYYEKGLVYRPNSELLTEDGTNSDYGWRIITKTELDEKGYISENTKKYAEEECLFVNYNLNEYKSMENIPENGNISNYKPETKYVNPAIGNNGERFMKVVLTRVLSPEIAEEFSHRNQAEIIQYSNNNSRRINWMKAIGNVAKCEYPISGNYVPTELFEVLPDEITHINEIDTAVTIPVILMPPTGKAIPHKNIYLYVFATSFIAINILNKRRTKIK